LLQMSDFYTALVITCAIGLDFWLGEPKTHHPLVYFGRLADKIEHSIYPRSHSTILTTQQQTWRGIAALVCAVLPLVLLLSLIPQGTILSYGVDIVILYLAIGNTSLRQHALQVYHALKNDDLDTAKQRVAMLVSRDTKSMQTEQVTHATIESVLENGNDAVFAAIFWYLVAGAPGVILYRLSNTLDAMWGYKNQRYLHFGWATAKWDDLLNWLPSRLAALTFALLGNTRHACNSWFTQAKCWESHNAGSVMAAGAASLGITLGGAASYHGKIKQRPILGHGKPPVTDDILRAIHLLQYGIAIWVLFIFLGSVAIA